MKLKNLKKLEKYILKILVLIFLTCIFLIIQYLTFLSQEAFKTNDMKTIFFIGIFTFFVLLCFEPIRNYLL